MTWSSLGAVLDPWITDPLLRRAVWIGVLWLMTLGLVRLNGRFFDSLDRRLTDYAVPERRLAKLDLFTDVFLVVIAALLTLRLLGVAEALWGAVALTSVAGVVVALAAQRLGENLLAGMVILFERPFVVGDTVELDGRTGSIEKVTLYATTMTTPSGLQVVLPNQKVLDGAITNYSVRPERRLELTIDVQVPNDRIDDALYAVRETVRGEEHLVEDREVVVFARESIDEGVRLEARYWVDSDHYGSHCLPSAMTRVLEGLEAEGLDTAMPTQKVYVDG